MSRPMNEIFALLYGPGTYRCPLCEEQYAVPLGPVQGCEVPPPSPGELARLARWSMSPAEWAGEPPRREPGY